ncbi:multicopper oxidase domain-containing protein [Aquihabitans sp. McL0605]|uniref:multicopper oxidase domain-containing protein n=1 Tax=Aquihabitans sp. McL0605 TaxID=3415671 RepID=UPI003CE9A7FB
MSSANQTLLARFAVATSIFALLLVGVVAVHGTSQSTDAGAAASAPVAVGLSEFAIAPQTIVVPLGGSIAVTNSGTMDHNLTVLDTAIKTTLLKAGATEALDVSSLEPGEYEVFCSVPGHKDSGMTAKLTVTDGSAGSATAAAETASSEHADHAAADLGSLESTDPVAKRFDKQMQQGMDEGVAAFLANADKYAAGTIPTGNQVLKPTILPDGTKQFHLTAAVTDWEVSPGKVVKAWTYNGMVPGPWIKVDPNDDVEIVLTNNLPISTDIHFHGVDVPNDQDGVAGITQDYIKPNTTYTYKFNVGPNNQQAMYHAHYHGQEAVLNGLFSIFQVGEVPMPKAGTYGQVQVPENVKPAQEIPMVLNDAGVIGLSLNGKAFPETAPIAAKKGDYILLHFYNEGLVGHPMHLHRQQQLVIAKDGFALNSPYQVDTLWVAPGERYSVLIHADEVGTWAFHCHILNHAESDTGLMGMVTAMVVTDPKAS